MIGRKHKCHVSAGKGVPLNSCPIPTRPTWVRFGGAGLVGQAMWDVEWGGGRFPSQEWDVTVTSYL